MINHRVRSPGVNILSFQRNSALNWCELSTVLSQIQMVTSPRFERITTDQMSMLCNTNIAKQCSHGLRRSCWLWGICFQKWKKRHLTSIISVFARSMLPPLTRTSGAPEVAKIGVSLLSSISRWQKFLGAGRCTVSPSSACRRSAQAIMVGLHLKSFKKMTSASSAPIHANEPVAELQKVR